MENSTDLKTKIRISIANFKDKCEANGQNGLISTAIAEEIKQALSEDQIKWLIYHLNR